jgi:4-hydroxy-tetrahydrodipicolinate synthase
MPLPLFLYNMPQMTKVSFAFESCQRLAQQQKIVGIKDSGGNLEYFFRLLELKRERPDWSILVGPEDLLLPTVRRGGDGGVNGGANVHPTLFVNLYAALVAGDTARADALHQQLLAFGKIYSVGRHASSVIKGLKCAVSLLGICDGEMAEPFQKFREPEQEHVRSILREAGLIA